MNEDLLVKILLGCISFLVIALIRRIEKGNELLTETAKDVAIIIVKLESFEEKIQRHSRDIERLKDELFKNRRK